MAQTFDKGNGKISVFLIIIAVFCFEFCRLIILKFSQNLTSDMV
nr:MAG TPA: hypothetical protein [Caudoviricetes sp.]